MSHKRTFNGAVMVMGGVLAIATVGVLLWGRLTSPTTLEHSSPAARTAIQLDRAARPMQEKIDAYTARVAEEETIEELAAGLNAYEDRLFFAAASPTEGSVETAFEVCLANRRVARLFEILRKRDDADALCRKLFEEKFDILRNDLLTCIERLDKKGGPRLVELPFKEPLLPVHEDRVALSGALFLSAEFCPVDEFLSQLDAWMSLRAELERTYDSYSATWEPSEWIELSRSSLEYDAPPEPRFLLNLLASMLYRRFGVDPGGTELDSTDMFSRVPEERWSDFSRPVPGMLGYYRVPLCAWDALTNPFDSTHVLRGIPTDDSHVLGEFLVFPSFFLIPVKGSHPVMGSEGEDMRERQQRILDRLRDALVEADRESREDPDQG